MTVIRAWRAGPVTGYAGRGRATPARCGVPRRAHGWRTLCHPPGRARGVHELSGLAPPRKYSRKSIRGPAGPVAASAAPHAIRLAPNRCRRLAGRPAPWGRPLATSPVGLRLVFARVIFRSRFAGPARPTSSGSPEPPSNPRDHASPRAALLPPVSYVGDPTDIARSAI